MGRLELTVPDVRLQVPGGRDWEKCGVQRLAGGWLKCLNISDTSFRKGELVYRTRFTYTNGSTKYGNEEHGNV